MKVYTVCARKYRFVGLDEQWWPITTWSSKSGAERELTKIMTALDTLDLNYRKQDYTIKEVEVDPIG